MPAPSVALNWIAVTEDVNNNSLVGAVTYNVYQGTAAPLTKVQSGLTAVSATVTTGLTPGTTQLFAVTAENNGQESAQADFPSVAIPFPVPAAPTGLTAVYIP